MAATGTPGSGSGRSVSGPVPAGWVELSAAVRACRACPELSAARQQVVAGDAPVSPGDAGQRPLVLVGEAPGAQEDALGRPFVGRAGQLLDTLLGEAGLDRSQAAVLNVVKCRPPGNRQPKPAEVARCRPWLEQQLRVLEPRLVVALGLTATSWFLSGPGRRRITLAAVRGEPHEVTVADSRYDVLATYHPSAAIRFGPAGAPIAALRADLALAATLMGTDRA